MAFSFSVRIWDFSGTYFPSFGPITTNTDNIHVVFSALTSAWAFVRDICFGEQSVWTENVLFLSHHLHVLFKIT